MICVFFLCFWSRTCPAGVGLYIVLIRLEITLFFSRYKHQPREVRFRFGQVGRWFVLVRRRVFFSYREVASGYGIQTLKITGITHRLLNR